MCGYCCCAIVFAVSCVWSGQVQGAYFDFAGQWTRTHTLKGTTDVVTDSVLRDFKNFVHRRQKEVKPTAKRNIPNISCCCPAITVTVLSKATRRVVVYHMRVSDTKE